MASSNLDRDPFEALTEEFVERCRQGAPPTIEEYERRHPELASDIRDLFPTILAVELAKGAPASGSAPRYTHGSPAVERLGDFRIIRELGRGGMGIVYEAEQESLGRRVAVKILPREFLRDASRKERFEREARTAARLHHTNIVPIFGVGEQDGCPYFVMQYICGVGLHSVFQALALRPGDRQGAASYFPPSDSLIRHARAMIDAHSSRSASGVDRFNETQAPRTSPCSAQDGKSAVGHWRSVAGLMIQAADAVHFAHSQGVLHRDIKPANLLIDGEGRLWVTDFGLAKALEHGELTEAGDLIGTLRYAAPEQLNGETDIRSDVYSLGITLYEMATLAQAHVASRRSGLARAILDGAITPPRARRPDIPADLETIILKATSRRPADRYASAGLLRDDLQRFVDGLPIHARRVSALQRGILWGRRNPALATAVMSVFALLLSIAAVSSAAFVRVRRANERAQEALSGQIRQRERAEATMELAIKALDTAFDELAPDGTAGAGEFSVEGTEDLAFPVAVPTVTPEAANLLGHMLDFYRQLAEQDDASHHVQWKVAGARRRLGQIYALLGRYSDADAAFREAVAAHAGMPPAEHDGSAVALAVAQTRNELGELLAIQDETLSAEEQFAAAADLLRPIANESSAPEEVRFELARTYYLSGRRRPVGVPAEPGPPPSPGGAARAMPPPRVGPPGSPPRPPGPRLGERPGPPPAPPGEAPGARLQRQRALETAIDLLNDLRARSAGSPRNQHLLALCLRERQRPPGRPPAIGSVDEAARLLEELVARFPKVPQYRLDYAETLAMRDRGPDAVEHLQRARAVLAALVDEYPNTPNYRFALGHIHLRLSRAHEVAEELDDAMMHARQALAIHAQLASSFPDVASFAMTAAFCESILADRLERRRELTGAKALLVSATQRLVGIGASEDPRPHIRGLAAHCFDQLAAVYEGLGEGAAASEAFDAARSFEPDPAFRPR